MRLLKRSCVVLIPVALVAAQEASWLGPYLAVRWIGDQMDYHGRRAAAHRRLAESKPGR